MRRIPRLVFATAAAALLAPVPVLAADPYGATDPAAAGETQPRDDTSAGEMQDDAQRQQEQQQQMSRQPGPGETEYTVEQGDTLASIAREKLGSAGKWQEIAEANDIQDPAQLRVGQKIVIPQSSGGSADDPAQHEPMRSQP